MRQRHVLPLYFARRIQDHTGATVYVLLSDDEKCLTKDLSFGGSTGTTRDLPVR